MNQYERASDQFGLDSRPVNFARMSPIDQLTWNHHLAKARAAGDAQSALQAHAAGKQPGWDKLSAIGKREADLQARRG